MDLLNKLIYAVLSTCFVTAFIIGFSMIVILLTH